MNRCSIRRKPQKSDCSKNLRERVAQGRIRSKGWRKTCRERLAQRQLGSDERHTEPQQMAQPATPAGCSVIEGDVFVSQKKGRHTELTWNTCRKWIWKIIFPWSSKVAVQRVPKTQWWITFSLKSSKNHLMGIPIFSSAIFRWSSDTSTISLRNYIHQQKTWSIPTLTQSTPRFCCFRKKKKRRLRCHVTGYALCLEPRLQHNGSPLGIIGTRDFPERTRWVKVAPNMRLFSISKHH